MRGAILALLLLSGAITPSRAAIPDAPSPQPDQAKPGAQGATVRVLKTQRMIVMEFGGELDWFSGPPDKMVTNAQRLRAMVIRNFGQLDYDKSQLPLRVVANKQDRRIEVHLPSFASSIAATPEMWLAFCDAIEDAGRDLEK